MRKKYSGLCLVSRDRKLRCVPMIKKINTIPNWNMAWTRFYAVMLIHNRFYSHLCVGFSPPALFSSLSIFASKSDMDLSPRSRRIFEFQNAPFRETVWISGSGRFPDLILWVFNQSRSRVRDKKSRLGILNFYHYRRYDKVSKQEIGWLNNPACLPSQFRCSIPAWSWCLLWTFGLPIKRREWWICLP